MHLIFGVLSITMTSSHKGEIYSKKISTKIDSNELTISPCTFETEMIPFKSIS